MLELFGYSLSYFSVALLFLVAFFIGMAKTGVHGISMFAVPLLAIMFGGKSSAGLMLPMLIMADLFAVKYYHRDANWGYLFNLRSKEETIWLHMDELRQDIFRR